MRLFCGMMHVASSDSSKKYNENAREMCYDFYTEARKYVNTLGTQNTSPSLARFLTSTSVGA